MKPTPPSPYRAPSPPPPAAPARRPLGAFLRDHAAVGVALFLHAGMMVGVAASWGARLAHLLAVLSMGAILIFLRRKEHTWRAR